MNISCFIRRSTFVLWTAVTAGVQGETRLFQNVPVLDIGAPPRTVVGSRAEVPKTLFADHEIFDQIYWKAR